MITEPKGDESLDLRNLIETIPALVVCALPDGSANAVNRAWREYTGVSEQQPSGWNWQNSVHPDDLARFIDEWNTTLASGKPFFAEARIKRADGEYHWFLIRKTLAVLPGPGGESSLRALIAFEDIDDRKRTEATLQQTGTLLQAFFENSPNVIFLKDRQGRYLYVNMQFQRAFGFNRDEIKGKSDFELFAPEQASVSRESDSLVLEEGTPRVFEEISVHKDGIHTSIVQRFPLFSAEGEIYAVCGIATDITDRKREESARRNIEERHRLALETASDAIVCIDDNGLILDANPATTELFGFDPLELIGQPLTVLMSEHFQQAHTNGFKRYLTTGRRHLNWKGTELSARHKNGQELPVEVSFGELKRDGHTIFTGFIRDIRERRKAEDVQRALQLTQMELARISRMTTMGELAASIAHEVNQPLTAVMNNGNACLRMLANNSLKPDILRRTLEEIVAAGTRASAVIARIRGFLKNTPAEMSELDVNEVIREVLALAGRVIEENQVSLHCDLAQVLPPVFGDRIQLQQVLLNLIMNGIEAMDAITDRPHELGVESRIDENGDVLVAVRDSGSGLGADADRIFDPFYTTKTNGMGMGLSISRTLINSHDGRLWASPNSPHGTVFWLALSPGRVPHE